MAQVATPISPDISQGGWSPTPLYAQIDEASPGSDLDYNTSSKNATGDTFEVTLSSLSDPNVHTEHTVNYRAMCDKSSNGTIVVSLVEGTTVIRSYDPGYLTTSFAPYSFTLTEGEAQSIGNYGNLRLRFVGNCIANAYVFLSWAEFRVPDITVQNRVLNLIVNA
jgi:hypothetical protein